VDTNGIIVDSEGDEAGQLGLNLVHKPTSQVSVDLIFVHGLRGGSQKTWTYHDHRYNFFWPEQGLAEDPDFDSVRIHSYGYSSDWAMRRENPMGIDGFGRAFLDELQFSTELRKDKDSKIVIVAHSMGGLVVKKAVVTARLDPEANPILDRIHTIFFFGTPHRGSSLAVTLNNYLKATLSSSKAFVNDLLPKSDSTYALNADFGRAYKGIKLYSFIENVPMDWKVGSGFIVDRNSATMGRNISRIIQTFSY
jgi:pimeloyl-ACP methyl ester carboxylesterase